MDIRKYLAKRNWEFEIQPLSAAGPMAVKYDDIINLSIGDPDLKPDEGILQAMYEGGLEGHTHYTDFAGDPELREEVCKQYKEYGVDINIENVMITAGGTTNMYLAMNAILDPGDEVIAVAPYYTYYKPQVEMNGGKLIEYATDKDQNFTIHKEDFEKLIGPRTRAVIFNNPSNPTGRVYTDEEINTILDIIEENDLILIVDDVYRALDFTGRAKPIHAYRNIPNIITLYSFSKDFSFTGIRLGYVLAHEEIIEAIQNINESINFTVNSMAQRGAIYALKNQERISKPLREEFEKRLNYAYERVKNIPNMQCSRPEGTFYLFIDIRQTGLSSEEIWHKILDDAKVLVLPGHGFGEAGEGFIRICCTVGVERLEEAFDRLEEMEIFQ